MRLELERRDDAEVAAGAAHGPEEILVLGRARPAQLAVGGDDVDREQVVDRQPVLAAQVADAAVERQAGDARRRHDAAGHREAEQLRLAVDVAPGRAALDAHASASSGSTWTPRIRDRSITRPPSFTALPATLWPPPLIDSGRSCSRAKFTASTTSAAPVRLHDQRRPPVDEPVPDRARRRRTRRRPGCRHRAREHLPRIPGPLLIECRLGRAMS